MYLNKIDKRNLIQAREIFENAFRCLASQEGSLTPEHKLAMVGIKTAIKLIPKKLQ